MHLAMKNIADSTYPKLHNPQPQRVFLFVTSIARTNLEAEIIQRGGSLCAGYEPRYKPKPGCLGMSFLHETFVIFFFERKRWKYLIIPCFFLLSHCLVPLLNLLSVHLRTMVKWPLWQQFVTFYQTECNERMILQNGRHELVPNMLKDPIALLIEYQLLAPLRMELGKKWSNTRISTTHSTLRALIWYKSQDWG